MLIVLGIRTWNNALSDSNGLENGECGLTDGSSAGDWRLPNRSELFSLLDDGYYDPALPILRNRQWSKATHLTTCSSNYYWSSTTDAYYTDYAWFVDMDYGYVCLRR